jgi:hypothetical protein
MCAGQSSCTTSLKIGPSNASTRTLPVEAVTEQRHVAVVAMSMLHYSTAGMGRISSRDRQPAR